jgi:CRISPR-associated endonuclease/helicase Cas3
MDIKDYYSRKDTNGDIQYLYDHLNNVAEFASSFSKAVNISKLTGLLHDLGKATIAFQDYLMNGGKKGSVTHSLQGALFIDDVYSNDELPDKLLKEILEMIISAHHNQLVDGITPDGSGLFIDKINRKDEDSLSYNEIKENFTSSANEYITEINSLYLLALDEINLYLDKIKKTFRYINSAQFSLGLFVKYLYSCLIDADRLDAYLFEVKENYQPLNPNWDDLIKIFELKINSYSTDTKIGLVRHIISEKCKVASEKDTGIYQLSVPTGGGKTLSSMRFALHHAKKYNKKHIIYVIPYLSIIEQTAKNIRDMFEIEQNSPLLLEHHSNIALSDDDEKKDYQKLAASRWDNPIIITTMVQFLETVMSSRGSKLRKLHNMQDSIIIFDEIQFLPTNTVHLFNEVVSFLSKILDSTILLCTATQPLLGLTERRNLILPDKPYLIDEVEGCYKDLKRTQIVVESEKCIEDFAHFIIKRR